MPGWPWPDEQVAYFARKARRAVVGHERAEKLVRCGLVVLALSHWRQDGQPVRNLQAWCRNVTLVQLGDWLSEFDDPDLLWIEQLLGYPDHSSGFGEKR